jgi:hypothetical protein
MKAIVSCFFILWIQISYGQSSSSLDTLLKSSVSAKLIQESDFSAIREHAKDSIRWGIPNEAYLPEVAILDWLEEQGASRTCTPDQLQKAGLISIQVKEQLQQKLIRSKGPTTQITLPLAKVFTLRENRLYGETMKQKILALQMQDFISKQALEAFSTLIAQRKPFNTGDILAIYQLPAKSLTLTDESLKPIDVARTLFENLARLVPNLKITQWAVTEIKPGSLEFFFKANGINYQQILDWNQTFNMIPGMSIEKTLYPNLPLGLFNQALLDMGEDERLLLAGPVGIAPEQSNQFNFWVCTATRKRFNDIQAFQNAHPEHNWSQFLNFTPSRFIENSGERATLFAKWQRYGLLSKSEQIKASYIWTLIEEELQKTVEKSPASRELFYLLYIKTPNNRQFNTAIQQDQFIDGVASYSRRLRSAKLINDTLSKQIQADIQEVSMQPVILLPPEVWTLYKAIEYQKNAAEKPFFDTLVQEARKRGVWSEGCQFELPIKDSTLTLCWSPQLPRFSASAPKNEPDLKYLRETLERLVIWFNDQFPGETLDKLKLTQTQVNQNEFPVISVYCQLNGQEVSFEYAELPEQVQPIPFFSSWWMNLLPYFKQKNFPLTEGPPSSPCVLLVSALPEQSPLGMADTRSFNMIILPRQDARWFIENFAEKRLIVEY